MGTLVMKNKTKRYSKKFKSWDHFVAMLFCQIALALVDRGEDPDKYYATQKMKKAVHAEQFVPYGRREGKTVLIIAMEEYAGTGFMAALIH